MIFSTMGLPLKVVGAIKNSDGDIEIECDRIEPPFARHWRLLHQLKTDGGIKEILAAAEPFLKEQRHD